jgi:hypothetical protein
MKKRSVAKKSNPRIYKSPLNSKGYPIFVPVVYKNKETLVSFLNGIHAISSLADMKFTNYNMFLSSERFNDITYKDKRLSKMTHKEKVSYVKDIILEEIEKDDNLECGEEILADCYFNVTCTCGNYYEFQDPKELPKDNFKCELCDKTLIHYTGKDDEYFMYDGKDIDMDMFIEEAEEELGIVPIEPLDEEDE